MLHKLIFYALIIACAFAHDALSQSANWKINQGFWKGKTVEYWENEILVKLKANADKTSLTPFLTQNDLELKRDFNKLRWGRIELQNNNELFAKIDLLEKHPLIEAVQPNFVYRASSYPNDTYYADGHQWAIYNYGQNPPDGTEDSDIDMPEAWEVTKGSSQVIIAVLDSGIPLNENGQLSHPDLNSSSKIILGPDFVPLDFVHNNYSTVRDECGHGTHVAGIIAAKTNNGAGIAGVTWNCKLLIVQVFGKEGNSSTETLTQGITYAADYSDQNEIPIVINFSGGSGSDQDEYIKNAVAYAEDMCPIVASAGNSPGGGPLEYPAHYANQHYNVISVGSTQYNDERAWYSNYGYELIMTAPGGADDNHQSTTDSGDIYSTMPNYEVEFNRTPRFISQNYGYMAGTSMAAPHVSGVVGLIYSLKPNLEPIDIQDIMIATAEKVPGMGDNDFTQYYGYGRLNANRTVLYTKYIWNDYQHPGTITTGNISGTLTENTLLYGNINVTNNLTVNSGVNLVIEDEAIVNVSSGKRITVNGTGTIIAKNVTFQKTAGGGNWYGIDVKGTGNASYIKNCTIKEAQYGILIGGSKYINIQNNYVSGSSAAISIYEYGAPQISDCYLQGGTEADVLSTGNAAGRIHNSQLYGAASSGHKNMGDAASLFNYYSSGRNIIAGRYGIASVYVLGGYPGYDYGVNVIERSYGCNFYNASGHSLNVRYNCWTGSVNNSGPLVLNPVYPSCPPDPIGPSWPLQKSSPNVLAEAWWAYSDGEFSKAEGLAEQVFNENKNGDQAAEALFLLMKCADQLGTLAEKQNRLAGILNNKEVHTAAKYEAVRWQMKYELKKKNIAAARALALSIPDTSNMSREILLSLAIGLIEELRDFAEAEKILSLYEAKSPIEESKQIKNEVLSFYKELYNGSPLPKESLELGGSIMPEKTELSGNYPNPFNPSTNIRYQLSTMSRVTLKAFDILGREVVTLLDEQKEAGYYSILFDGSQLASGIYFVRLVAQSEGKPFVQTRKLLLMK